MEFFNHFTSKEFFPSCSDSEILQCVKCGHFGSLLTLFQILDSLRDELNKPIIVTSTFRDTYHNSRVGGVSTSQHLYGSAADFKVSGIPFPTLKYLVREFLEKSALKVLVGQVIFYNKRQFIHLGLRTQTHKSLNFLYYE